MTKEQALELFKTEFWKYLTPRQIAEFQLNEERLCMPFSVFQNALEITLGRSVYTHELGLNYQGIKEEVFSGKPPPSLEDILDLIPEEKRILVVLA